MSVFRRLIGLEKPLPVVEPALAPVVINPFLRFEQRRPSHQTAVDVFRDRWACDLKPLIGVDGTGSALLFTHDTRPEEAARTLGVNGRFDGFDVLELGPLEAAHTYHLEKLGANSITAVEASVEAYLKCLIVKEILDLTKSRFIIGDVVEFMNANNTRFDLVFCSGILYHMSDPVALIEKCAGASDRCFVWTHYYSPERHPVPFSAHTREFNGFKAKYWSHEYGDRSAQFWGGNQKTATWLEKETLLDSFLHFGMTDITVIKDHYDHPNGPAITFTARRL